MGGAGLPHPGVLTALAPLSGRSPSWTRSSCTAWRTCVAAPDTSVVSGEGEPWGRAGEGQPVGRLQAGPWVTVAIPPGHPVRAPVCLSRELGVMLPGQTVVELSADGGVCHTSRCTDVLDPLTSFYQINTTSVLCDVRCEAVGRGRGGGPAWGPGDRVTPGAPGIRASSLLDESGVKSRRRGGGPSERPTASAELRLRWEGRGRRGRGGDSRSAGLVSGVCEAPADDRHSPGGFSVCVWVATPGEHCCRPHI